jgi:crotonobetainyl-CoA:carnitine CoA-transferase CaiB-like acyl-CoA transferase
MTVLPNFPLAGIVVVDFGQVFQGPYATLLMAKAGADVIKVEPPRGEPLRRRAPPGKSTTFPIAMLNSNKCAITLNLKHERGRALRGALSEGLTAHTARSSLIRRIASLMSGFNSLLPHN